MSLETSCPMQVSDQKDDGFGTRSPKLDTAKSQSADGTGVNLPATTTYLRTSFLLWILSSAATTIIHYVHNSMVVLHQYTVATKTLCFKKYAFGTGMEMKPCNSIIRVYIIYSLIFKRHVTLYIETHYGNVWNNLKFQKY